MATKTTKKANKETKENQAQAWQDFDIIDNGQSKYMVVRLSDEVEKTKAGTGKIATFPTEEYRNGKKILSCEYNGDKYFLYSTYVYVEKVEKKKEPSPVNSAKAKQEVINSLTQAMALLEEDSEEYKALQRKLGKASLELAELL